MCKNCDSVDSQVDVHELKLSPRNNRGSVIEELWSRINERGLRAWSNDNVSEIFETERDYSAYIDELAERFATVVDGLLIDYKNDPNAEGTPRRLAKMYVNELARGRFFETPAATAFPNIGSEKYDGMLVTRVELKSLCAHHWAPVDLTGYIGIIPTDKVIGLSKYTRLADHLSRRFTLSETLTVDIANIIQEYTGSESVAVYLQGTHGCMELRGVECHSSLTQTTILRGEFLYSPTVKDEFFKHVQLQQVHHNH